MTDRPNDCVPEGASHCAHRAEQATSDDTGAPTLLPASPDETPASCQQKGKQKPLATHLVEQLHHHEGIEDYGVVLGGALHACSGGHPKNGISLEHQGSHHGQLEGALRHNVLDDLQACRSTMRTVIAD